MILAIKQTIKERTKTYTTLAQIVDGLEDTGDLFNSTFLVKDIYNAKTRIRRQALGNLTPI